LQLGEIVHGAVTLWPLWLASPMKSGFDVGNRQCHNYHLAKWSRSLDRPSMVIMVKVIGDVREKSNMEPENRVWRMCLLLKIACFRCYFCCLNLILLWFWYPYICFQ
jgi:hypothetical protein